jgi:hypothetical protein
MSAPPTTDLSGLGKVEVNPTRLPENFRPIALTDLWTLYYRKGRNPFPMIKVFVYKAQTNDPQKNLAKAIDVGRDHCERITARFLRCEPFIAELNAEEQRYADE